MLLDSVEHVHAVVVADADADADNFDAGDFDAGDFDAGDFDDDFDDADTTTMKMQTQMSWPPQHVEDSMYRFYALGHDSASVFENCEGCWARIVEMIVENVEIQSFCSCRYYCAVMQWCNDAMVQWCNDATMQ